MDAGLGRPVDESACAGAHDEPSPGAGRPARRCL